MAEDIYLSLQRITKVPHGYASVKDVGTGELEDRMCSFFLAETLKYLYLIFDDDNFVHNYTTYSPLDKNTQTKRPKQKDNDVIGNGQFIFSTEGHLFPVTSKMQEKMSSIWATTLRSIEEYSALKDEKKRKEASKQYLETIRNEDNSLNNVEYDADKVDDIDIHDELQRVLLTESGLSTTCNVMKWPQWGLYQPGDTKIIPKFEEQPLTTKVNV